MNNLDKFYNKKLQNRAFDFKNAYWEEAEQMIIADEKNRRTGFYYWLFALLLLLIIGGGLFWVGNLKPEVQESATAIAKTDSENETTIAKSTNQNIQQSSDQASKKENNASELSFISSKTNDQNISNRDFEDNSITKKPTLTSEAEGSRFTKNYNLIGDQSTSTISNEIKDNEQKILLQSSENRDVNFENVTPKPESKETVDAKFASVAVLSPITSLSNEIEGPAYENLKLQTIPKDKKYNVGLTASSLFYPANNNEKAWIGASLGLVGQYKFLKQFSINTEVLYTYRTGTFGTVSKSEQTTFGFGKQLVEYHLNPESIHFVELPIFVQYHLGRNGIEAGLSFSYLAGVYGNIEKQSSLQPWERNGENKFSKENQYKGWLAKEGFNAFNTSVLLGYRYSFSQNFVLGFRSFYRFGDLLKDSENKEQAFLESGALHFNVSASWFFLK